MAARVAALTVTAYRLLISPFLPPACRFYPTCSAYAVTAFQTHGFWKGTGLTAWRLLRCHPLHPGGYDPVPAGGPAAGGTPSSGWRCNDGPEANHPGRGLVHGRSLAVPDVSCPPSSAGARSSPARCLSG